MLDVVHGTTSLKRTGSDAKDEYDLREQLSAIFEADHNKASAMVAIKRWVKQVHSSGLSCFD
jgi:hypothetical protein